MTYREAGDNRKTSISKSTKKDKIYAYFIMWTLKPLGILHLELGGIEFFS